MLDGRERRYINTPRKFINTSKKFVSTDSQRHGTGAVHKREINKPPVLYGKSDSRVDTIKKILPQKRAAPKITEPFSKIAKVAPAKKQDIEQPSLDPTPDGHYELSPLMSRMVEAELDDIMIKIWQMLPEDASDEAEKVVAERFKNKAGNSLRNTLGLNVTKRLLNVHNPLYVKIVFSGKPPQADLMDFILTHNVTAFKKVGERGEIYAAKMKSFQDFDDLCTNKKLTCGTIRVTVTPCYQFMKCPPNLRTRFDGKEGTQSKSASYSGQAAKHQENIPTNKPETITTIKQNNPVVPQEATKPNEKKNASITPPAPANKQNVTPKVTPTKTSQAVAVNKVAPKVTSAKTCVPAAENKQPAASITPKPSPATYQDSCTKIPAAKASQAASLTQKPAPKVTPVKPNTAVAEKKNAAKNVGPTMPAAANNQNSVQTTTPSKPVAVNNQNTAPKPTPPKPAATSNQKSFPTTTPSKPVAVNNQNTAPKPPLPKSAATSNQKSVPTTTKPVAVNNQNTAPKPTPPKPAATSNQKSVPTTTPSKPVAVNNQNTAPKPTPPKPAATNNLKAAPKPSKPNAMTTGSKLKPAPKVTNPKQRLFQAPKPKQISPKKKNDYDELDDHDILALITEGIVVDECSGSDED